MENVREQGKPLYLSARMDFNGVEFATKDVDLKLLNERKMELEEIIAKFMNETGSTDSDTGTDMISIMTSKTSRPPNKGYLRQTLLVNITDETLADQIDGLALAKKPFKNVQKVKLGPKKKRSS
ncbi:hypothetical protein BDK51DRAFT_29422 [Blyttiomyces helicus]|uniref:Uncharacterized protein n=1 Tax=Blyttiomyces helicus TaxID=388810 RepID=A0A4P9WLP4_9FUNG|nr:hypothetical protein BDK51DRAFT_29422 [Blyttiomyces helicus]|eukprot:RKO93105.1 hypothetical protein BDK51DRAFT_29422 [Blyttiomyces helicus]